MFTPPCLHKREPTPTAGDNCRRDIQMWRFQSTTYDGRTMPFGCRSCRKFAVSTPEHLDCIHSSCPGGLRDITKSLYTDLVLHTGASITPLSMKAILQPSTNLMLQSVMVKYTKRKE